VFGPNSLVFSPDSHLLAFSSQDTDLTANTPDDSSANTAPSFLPTTNLFLRDLTAGTTTLVNATPDGHVGGGTTVFPSFSPDGSRLAFLSSATGLTPNAPSSAPSSTPFPGMNLNLYVRDLAAGTNSAVSVTTGGTLSAGNVFSMAFSPDGQSLAFSSSGTDLTSDAADPPPGGSAPSDPVTSMFDVSNVYVRHLSTGTTQAVSLTPGGKLSNGMAGNPLFSPDGRSLAYASSALDLTSNAAPPPQVAPPIPGGPSVPIALPPGGNLFVTDLASRKTSVVTATPGGSLSHGQVGQYAFSPDSSKLAFSDQADDLTNAPPPPSNPGAFSSLNNVFIRDLAAQTTTLLSVTPAGTLAPDSFSGVNSPVFFSTDGQTLYFSSDGALVPSDTNGTTDIYSATAPFLTPGAIHFSSWQYDANEIDLNAVITVVRNAPFDGAASVNYSVQDGTAHAGNDYQAASGTLSFAPGQSSATFSIPLNGAAAFPGLKTATISLSNPTGGVLDSTASTTATLDLSGNQTQPRDITTPFWASSLTPQITTFQTPQTTSSAAGSSTPTPTPTPTTTSTSSAGAQKPTTPTPTPTPTSTSTSSSSTGTGSKSPTPTAVNSVANTVTSLLQSSIAAAAAQSGSTAGPVVSGVMKQTARHKLGGVVLSFNKPLSSSAAANPANYLVNLVSVSQRGKHGVRSLKTGRAVGIASAVYNATAQTVTLTFTKRLAANQMFQLRVNGAKGGITDAGGSSLNSPSRGASGSDYLYTTP
jgi:Tol biopolymer transport system component